MPKEDGADQHTHVRALNSRGLLTLYSPDKSRLAAGVGHSLNALRQMRACTCACVHRIQFMIRVWRTSLWRCV